MIYSWDTKNNSHTNCVLVAICCSFIALLVRFKSSISCLVGTIYVINILMFYYRIVASFFTLNHISKTLITNIIIVRII